MGRGKGGTLSASSPKIRSPSSLDCPVASASRPPGPRRPRSLSSFSCGHSALSWFAAPSTAMPPPLLLHTDVREKCCCPFSSHFSQVPWAILSPLLASPLSLCQWPLSSLDNSLELYTILSLRMIDITPPPSSHPLHPRERCPRPLTQKPGAGIWVSSLPPPPPHLPPLPWRTPVASAALLPSSSFNPLTSVLPQLRFCQRN